MSTARKKNEYHGSIKSIWGIAKSPELMLSDDDLYAIIMCHTKKDSMRSLSQSEIDNICRILQNMKDDSIKDKPKNSKRTDEGGNEETELLRKKVYALTDELGWNNDNRRINGFVMRMFKVSRIEWLTYSQCIKLVEILKKMVAREAKGKADEKETD